LEEYVSFILRVKEEEEEEEEARNQCVSDRKFHLQPAWLVFLTNKMEETCSSEKTIHFKGNMQYYKTRRPNCPIFHNCS
jgi:hypothetical protein